MTTLSAPPGILTQFDTHRSTVGRGGAIERMCDKLWRRGDRGSRRALRAQRAEDSSATEPLSTSVRLADRWRRTVELSSTVPCEPSAVRCTTAVDVPRLRKPRPDHRRSAASGQLARDAPAASTTSTAANWVSPSPPPGCSLPPRRLYVAHMARQFIGRGSTEDTMVAIVSPAPPASSRCGATRPRVHRCDCRWRMAIYW